MSRPKPNAPNTRAWTAPLSTLTPSVRTTAWTRPLGEPRPCRWCLGVGCQKCGCRCPVGRKSRLPPLPSIETAVTLWGGVVGRA